MTATLPTTADRDAVLARIADGAADRERRGIDPRDEIRLLADAGLTAFTLDRADGGAGAGVVELLDLIIDLARADPIVAHILRAHFWFVEHIRRLRAGPVRDAWSARVARGEIFGNATSERTGEAGIRRFTTELRPVDGGWLLTGDKFYSTGTTFADWVLTMASLPGKREQVARIVIPVDRTGVTVIDDWDGIGQHRTGTGTTTFRDVFISADDFISLTDAADEAAVDAAPVANDGPLLQLYLQALITGILLSVTDDAADILRTRTRSFSHAPAPRPREDPVLLETAGRLDAAAHVARSAVLAAAAEVEAAHAPARNGVIDAGAFTRASVSAARVKVHLDEVGLRSAADLFEVGGASVASRARNLDRHWRNIRTITLHNPAAYKAVAIGDHLVNHTPLPANGYF